MKERGYLRAERKKRRKHELSELKTRRKRDNFSSHRLPQQSLAASELPSAVRAAPESPEALTLGNRYIDSALLPSVREDSKAATGSSSRNMPKKKTRKGHLVTKNAFFTPTVETDRCEAFLDTATKSQEGVCEKTAGRGKGKEKERTPPNVIRIKEKPARFTHPRLDAVLGRLRRGWLSPGDDLYQAALERSYRGMMHLPRDDLPPSVHGGFRRCFDSLNDAGLFLYDTVQAGGKRLSRTFVTRTLVGDAGITYKYLGLRLFAHPWNATSDFRAGPDDILPDALSDPCLADLFREESTNENDCELDVDNTLQKMRKLSEWMRACAEGLLEGRSGRVGEEGGRGRAALAERGSCAFNLTLINRMESAASKRDLKPDPLFAMGKCSVSWHADSCLEDFSTIGVYHCTEPVPAEPDWGIALRVSQEAHGGGGGEGGPQGAVTSKRKRKRGENLTGVGALEAGRDDVLTPPLLVPLQSGDAYFLLDDFNHFHEHAVVSGRSTLRYSSTHRVATIEGNTFSSLQRSCEEVLAGIRGKADAGGVKDSIAESRRQILDVAQVRAEQSLLTELEAEWLNQFWVQGRRHAALHPWWKGPMALMLATWRELERRTALAVERLLSFERTLPPSNGGTSGKRGPEPAVVAKAFDTVLRALEERKESRSRWASRFSDPAYRSLSADCAPVVPDFWSCEHASPPYEASGVIGGEEDPPGGRGAVDLLPGVLGPVICRLRECYKEAFRAACGGKKASSAKAIASGAASNWELFLAASRRKEEQQQQQQNKSVTRQRVANSSVASTSPVASGTRGPAQGKKNKGKSSKRRRRPV